MYNIPQLKKDMKEIGLKCRVLKLAIKENSRKSYSNWKLCPELATAKSEATDLYTIRASLRGRVHGNPEKLDLKWLEQGKSKYWIEPQRIAV
jgi:hypothetical protein